MLIEFFKRKLIHGSRKNLLLGNWIGKFYSSSSTQNDPIAVGLRVSKGILEFYSMSEPAKVEKYYWELDLAKGRIHTTNKVTRSLGEVSCSFTIDQNTNAETLTLKKCVTLQDSVWIFHKEKK